MSVETVVVGAGPAGLTAARTLQELGHACLVIESDDQVGGISRTVVRDGWRFDIGGHRFFTKVERVEKIWHQVLPEEDFLLRPRMSRIYYRGKFFDYPIKPLNALRGLGIIEAIRCMCSYFWVRINPPKDQSTFEGWVASRFGWRLYRIFFKTYTEKVWGVPATSIQADWAAQRIKNLSLLNAVVTAILPSRNQKKITSLIEEFQYPKLGPGMMWEACAKQLESTGIEVQLRTRATQIDWSRNSSTLAVHTNSSDSVITCNHLVSTMPINELVQILNPSPDPEVLHAARNLKHRDFLTVAIVVPEEFSFPDNWIYIHSPEVRVGRVQNYGSWSPFLIKDGKTCLGLEYFVSEGDDLWEMDDHDLVQLAIKELEILSLIDSGFAEMGFVVRVPKAYPVYDKNYQTNVQTIKDFLSHECPHIHPVGRNGMHHYNNQDHSMMTAILTAENIALGTSHDVWSVNVEEDYHETAVTHRSSGTGRSAPIT